MTNDERLEALAKAMEAARMKAIAEAPEIEDMSIEESVAFVGDIAARAALKWCGFDPENPPEEGAVGLVIRALEKTRCDCGHQGLVLCDRCACLRLLRGDGGVFVPDVRAAVAALKAVKAAPLPPHVGDRCDKALRLVDAALRAVGAEEVE